MIARTRPYINIENAINFLKHYHKCGINSNNDFYLNSGQACLEVFLKCYNRNARVGIQVFTCPTVLDAIKRVGDIPVFMDINSEYFTATLDCVNPIIDKIDILIVTHVLGIPNPDYIKIKQLCKEWHVTIIDDLCQTYRAKINGKFVEDISDNYFYSFYYDKPISCASGGLLHTSNTLCEKVLAQIRTMKKTSNFGGIMNIRRLINTQLLLSPDIYIQDCRNGSVAEMLLLSFFPLRANHRFLYKIMSTKLYSIVGRLLPKYSYSSNVKLMSDIQISFINKLFVEYRNNTKVLKKYFYCHDIPLPVFLLDNSIECSCSQRAIIKREDNRYMDTEIELYNWPKLIDNQKSYPNAEYVVSNFVNIPIVNY